MSTAKVILGVAIGMAAGAAWGALFASGEGKSLRKTIIDKGEELASALNNRIDARIEELSRKLLGKAGESPARDEAANLVQHEVTG